MRYAILRSFFVSFTSLSLPLPLPSIISKSKETEFLALKRISSRRYLIRSNYICMRHFPPSFREEERRIELLDGYLRRDETN